MTYTTREGKEVFPADAPIRLAMPKKTLCRTCRHAADICANIHRSRRTHGSYRLVYDCDGYEEIAP